MSEKNVKVAAAYYAAMDHKDFAFIESSLHPDVELITPLAHLKGKQDVLHAVKQFASFIKGLVVRAQCGNGDQVMLAYDVECPAPIGLIHGAVLFTFQEGLIKHYELFYDGRPFEQKKEAIFARS